MKKLLVSLLVVAFFISCSDSKKKEKATIPDEKSTLEQVEGSECLINYKACIEPLEKVYAQAVEEAADKLKADSISKDEYTAVCDSAFAVMQKEIHNCDKVFEKCLIEE